MLGNITKSVLFVANVRHNGQKYKNVEWFIIYFYFQYRANLIVFSSVGIRYEAGVLIGSYFHEISSSVGNMLKLVFPQTAIDCLH